MEHVHACTDTATKNFPTLNRKTSVTFRQLLLFKSCLLSWTLSTTMWFNVLVSSYRNYKYFIAPNEPYNARHSRDVPGLVIDMFSPQKLFSLFIFLDQNHPLSISLLCVCMLHFFCHKSPAKMIAVLGIRDDKSVTDDLFSKLWHFCI